MLKNQDAGKVLSSSVPKSQLTMVDGFGGALPARYNYHQCNINKFSYSPLPLNEWLESHH